MHHKVARKLAFKFIYDNPRITRALVVVRKHLRIPRMLNFGAD